MTRALQDAGPRLIAVKRILRRSRDRTSTENRPAPILRPEPSTLGADWPVNPSSSRPVLVRPVLLRSVLLRPLRRSGNCLGRGQAEPRPGSLPPQQQLLLKHAAAAAAAAAALVRQLEDELDHERHLGHSRGEPESSPPKPEGIFGSEMHGTCRWWSTLVAATPLASSAGRLKRSLVKHRQRCEMSGCCRGCGVSLNTVTMVVVCRAQDVLCHPALKRCHVSDVDLVVFCILCIFYVAARIVAFVVEYCFERITFRRQSSDGADQVFRGGLSCLQTRSVRLLKAGSCAFLSRKMQAKVIERLGLH